MSSDHKPMCILPFTAFAVDPNKGVKPCCEWVGDHVGNLKKQNLESILHGEQWTEIKNKLRNRQWPSGCLSCHQREALTGNSLRKKSLENKGGYDLSEWERGINLIELNTSNVCNLACKHCTPEWSSGIKKHWEKLEIEYKNRGKRFPWPSNAESGELFDVFLPEPSLLLEQLKNVDLSYLRTVCFKGGEPFLNDDMKTFLEFLSKKDLLKNIKVLIVSNGTRFDQEAFELLKQAKRVRLLFSVDGVGKVQEYIRYGDASTEIIEETIRKYAKLPNAVLHINTSIMAYNAFHILDIANWWENLADEVGNAIKFVAQWFVHQPKYLSLGVLSDATRNELYDYYKARAPEKRFGRLFEMLRRPYLGDKVHNRWVERTKIDDEVRGIQILDWIPELEAEMELR